MEISTSKSETQKAEIAEHAPIADADRDFKNGMRWSLSLHLAIALFVLVKSLVFPGEPSHYTPTLRVDIVGLPDVLKKDLADIRKSSPNKDLAEALKEAAIDAKKIKKHPPAPKDEMALKPKHFERDAGKEKKKNLKSRNKYALDRIKALDKLGIDSPSKKTKLVSQDESDQLIKGNMISKGSSLSADAKEAAEENYYDLLRDRLQGNWALPVWVARQNLSARVQIYVDSRGRLRNFRMLKSSGNSQFDDAVRRSINESQPFPPPPEAIASGILSSGVTVGFPL